MTKKKWINIRIETKAREFQSKTLLAYQLIEKGYGVVFKTSLDGDVHRFPKGLYFLNSIYSDTYSTIREIVNHGNKVFVLDEEGLVIRSEEEYLKRIDYDSFQMVSKFLCYGVEQYEILKKKFLTQENKLEITGNPRINLLNDKFNELEDEVVSKIKEKYGPFILIVSNFGTVNLYGSNVSREDRYKTKYSAFVNMKLVNNEDEKIDFFKRFNHYENIFQEFLKLASELGEKYSHMNIIVRPHPSEDPKIWERLTLKYRNIRVIYEGNLTEWIKASNIVIQNGCTSAIESLILNKTCISFRPYIDEQYDQYLPGKLSVNVQKIEDVYNIVDKALVSDENIFKNNYESFKELLEKYISKDKGDESIKAIVDLIVREDIKTDYFNPTIYRIKSIIPKVWCAYVKHKVKLYGAFIVYNILSRFNFRNNPIFFYVQEKIQDFKRRQDFYRNKVGDINRYEFEHIFEKYNKIYRKNIQLKVVKIDKDTFIVK